MQFTLSTFNTLYEVVRSFKRDNFQKRCALLSNEHTSSQVCYLLIPIRCGANEVHDVTDVVHDVTDALHARRHRCGAHADNMWTVTLRVCGKCRKHDLRGHTPWSTCPRGPRACLLRSSCLYLLYWSKYCFVHYFRTLDRTEKYNPSN